VMKPTLKPGLTHRFAFPVPVSKTVPWLYPGSPEFRAMPSVFATGFMVGLMEWTCVQLEHFPAKWTPVRRRKCDPVGLEG
jgi:fluoroacetyl-CoA thioesterase